MTVLPITSNVDKIYPFEVALPTEASGLPKASKAQAQQIRTIARERIVDKLVGQLDTKTMGAVDRAVQLHLAL